MVTMTLDKVRLLRFALVVIGVIFVVGVPVLMMTSSSWSWSPSQHEYEQMIMGVYMTLGIFLIRAAWDPIANRSLIGFTVWSSLVHGAIMLVQSIVDVGDRDNLLGDIPALFAVAAILWFLMPTTPEPDRVRS